MPREPLRDPDWYIQRRPCPGANQDDLRRLVHFVAVTITTSFVRNHQAEARRQGLGLPDLRDPRWELGVPFPFFDRFGGVVDDDGADPDSEGQVPPRA